MYSLSVRAQLVFMLSTIFLSSCSEKMSTSSFSGIDSSFNQGDIRTGDLPGGGNGASSTPVSTDAISSDSSLSEASSASAAAASASAASASAAAASASAASASAAAASASAASASEAAASASAASASEAAASASAASASAAAASASAASASAAAASASAASASEAAASASAASASEAAASASAASASAAAASASAASASAASSSAAVIANTINSSQAFVRPLVGLGNVTLEEISLVKDGTANCIVFVNSASPQYVTLSNCTGNGTVTVKVRNEEVGITATVYNPLRMAGGYAHACAIKNAGLYCWGDNWKWALSDIAPQNWSSQPYNGSSNHSNTRAYKIFSSGVADASLGFSHTCALVNGGIYCWGWNGDGTDHWQGGSSTLKPKAVVASGVTKMYAGYNSVCGVVRADSNGQTKNQIQCWVPWSNPVPRVVEDDVSSSNVVFSKLDSSLWSNSFTLNYAINGVPKQYQNGSYNLNYSMNQFKRDRADRDNCDISDTGEMQCTAEYYASLPVSLSGIVKVTGGLTKCSLNSAGAVDCWGYNWMNQANLESTQERQLTPNRIWGSGVVDIIGGVYPKGAYYKCAQFTNNTVQCWGHLVNSSFGSPKLITFDP